MSINVIVRFISKNNTLFHGGCLLKVIIALVEIVILLCSCFSVVSLLPANDIGMNDDSFFIQQTNSVSYSQIEWSKFFGGSQLDWGWSVQQTYDEGYIIAGETTSFGAGGYDAWLIKTDGEGSEVWNKTFGGELKDGARSVLITRDSCIVMAGYTDSFGHGYTHDFWLIKTDNTGHELWNRTYGGSHSEAGFSVFQTTDGGFIITGYTYSFGAGANDVWLIKTNPTGYEVWNKTFGGPEGEYGMSVQQTTDQGFIIAGSTSSFGDGNDDGWLIKTDSDGNELWNKTIGGGNNDWFGSVAQTRDGGYIVTGDTASFSTGGYDAWFIKTDGSGVSQWQTVCGEAFFHETGYSIQQMNDGGFIATGSITSRNTSLSDLWVRELNSSGTEQWYLMFPGAKNDCGYSVRPTKDGGSVVVGYTDSFGMDNRNVIVIKLSSNNENLPPATPTLTGPSQGIVGRSYNFSTCTIDLDNDAVFFWFDWGDGNNSGWFGPYNSSVHINTTYKWTVKGVYDIKVKAKDISGAESPWSDPLPIMMPYTIKPIWQQFFDWLFQRFPNAFPILRQLMGN